MTIKHHKKVNTRLIFFFDRKWKRQKLFCGSHLTCEYQTNQCFFLSRFNNNIFNFNMDAGKNTKRLNVQRNKIMLWLKVLPSQDSHPSSCNCLIIKTCLKTFNNKLNSFKTFVHYGDNSQVKMCFFYYFGQKPKKICTLKE